MRAKLNKVHDAYLLFGKNLVQNPQQGFVPLSRPVHNIRFHPTLILTFITSHLLFINTFPTPLTSATTVIVDLRAIAAQVFGSEDNWKQVRIDLYQEIQQNKELYDGLFPEVGCANNMLRTLNWFEETAPHTHWMDAMTMGVVIASTYNIVLHSTRMRLVVLLTCH